MEGSDEADDDKGHGAAQSKRAPEQRLPSSSGPGDHLASPKRQRVDLVIELRQFLHRFDVKKMIDELEADQSRRLKLNAANHRQS